ncbi:alpha-L-fucosidase [Pirellulales bacterium]|nr:alpha-L-fucosidase [Pirellulales bacterium]
MSERNCLSCGSWLLMRHPHYNNWLVWIVSAISIFAVQITMAEEEAAEPSQSLARPTPQQAAWQDMEIGMFIHFGLETWQDKETDDEPDMEYVKLFNPTSVDTDQWVSVAKSMGAKYIILVAKHHGGFCLWQTDTTEYSIKNSPYKNGKGDIVLELAESCRKQGMKLGIYISPADYSQKTGGGGKSNREEVQEKYSTIYRQQWTELLSRYGEMMEVWFDGSTVVKMDDIIEKHAPNAMVFQSPWATIRWVGNEDGYAPYPAWNAVNSDDPAVQAGHSTARHGDPDGDKWLPNEVDARIRSTWFWNRGGENTLKSVDKLMDMYYNSVGHSSVLLLNIAPDKSGRMPQADVKRAAEFGAEVKRRFGKSIAQTKGTGDVVELKLDRPATIDHVIAMEDITKGDRVREYTIEGLFGGNWEKIVEGISIGHKKIDKFEPIEVSRIRLNVTKAAANPIIRKLAVYNTIATPSTYVQQKRHSDGYNSVWTWSPDSVTNRWTTIDIDLSSSIPESKQYELVFKNTAGQIEIESVILVLEGIEIPGFAESLDQPNTYNVNITATPSMKKESIILRAKIRTKGSRDSHGQVVIKPSSQLKQSSIKK